MVSKTNPAPTGISIGPDGTVLHVSTTAAVDSTHPTFSHANIASSLLTSGMAAPDVAKVDSAVPDTPTPLAGGRTALRRIARDLTPEEMTSPGTIKMLVEILETSERERDENREFKEKYYVCETRAQLSEERLKAKGSLEIMFATGQQPQLLARFPW